MSLARSRVAFGPALGPALGSALGPAAGDSSGTQELGLVSSSTGSLLINERSELDLLFN